MNKNDFTDFKFLSRIYLSWKRKRLEALDMQIQSLKLQLDSERKQLHENTVQLQELLEKKAASKNQYESLELLLENENKTISIKNNGYNLTTWDNLQLKKKGTNYVLETKKDQEVYVFDMDMNDFMDYFSSRGHSIVVLSADRNRILIQFRFK